MLQQTRLVHPPFSGIAPASSPSHMQCGLRHPLPTACQTTRQKASITAAAARDTSWEASPVQAPPVDVSEGVDSFGLQQPMEAQPILQSATAAPKDGPHVSLETAQTKPVRTQALQPKPPRDPVSRAKRAEARSRLALCHIPSRQPGALLIHRSFARKFLLATQLARHVQMLNIWNAFVSFFRTQDSISTCAMSRHCAAAAQKL